MQSVLFQNAERIIKAVLDWLQGSSESSITERSQDIFSDGVLQGSLNNMAIIGPAIDNTLIDDGVHVKVDAGVAYKNGERIAISLPLSSYDTSVGFVNSINLTTDDGLGNPILTPQSTGSFNIPLTAGVINYIYIKYLLDTDTSVFTLNKLTSAKQFYKATDGYAIVVNTTGLNPDPSLYLFLGQVDLTTSPAHIANSMISIVNRDVCKSIPRRIGIQTSSAGRTDRPATYTGDVGGSQTYFLDDHIKAVGSGTISPTNPHALSLVDLGIGVQDTVQAHRQLEHGNGIISPTSYPTTSGLNCVRVVVFPETSGNHDHIIVQNLTGQEFAIVNGIAYGSSVLGGNITVLFSNVSDPSNTYYIYFDSTTQTIKKTSAAITNDPTKFWLCSVVWDMSLMTLSIPIDLRHFGTIQQIARWSTSGRPAFPVSAQFGLNLDTLRPEFYNGTTWITL